MTGGRNIADEYFGRSEPANFIDMDILSSGPVVRELSNVYDRYWNSEHTYPVQSLAARASTLPARAATSTSACRPWPRTTRWPRVTRWGAPACKRNSPAAAWSSISRACRCMRMRRPRSTA